MIMRCREWALLGGANERVKSHSDEGENSIIIRIISSLVGMETYLRNF